MNEIIEILRSYNRLGEKKLENGAMLIGRAPHIAPMAWLHTIYKPLSTEEIDSLESKLKMPIPKPHRDFLHLTNGLNVFNTTFALYGLRRNYERSIEASRQPFDIMLPNIDERPRDAHEDYFFIGGYDWDGSLLYFDSKDNRVFRCSRDSAKALNTWNSFQEMMRSEVIRLCQLFDENGKEIHKSKPTTP